MKNLQIALVVNDSSDSRVADFGRLLGTYPSVALFLVSAKGKEWTKLNSRGEMGPPLDDPIRPKKADVMLVHESDWDSCFSEAKKQVSGECGRVYVFNAPGSPRHKEGATRILSSTNPFALTGRDAEQLMRYATESNAPIPTCCAKPAQTLIALDILCQCYRAAHADGSLQGFADLDTDRTAALREKGARTESPDWWRTGLGLTTFLELSPRLKEDKVSPEDNVQLCSKLTEVKDAIESVGKSKGSSIEVVTKEEAGALERVKELHDLVKSALS